VSATSGCKQSQQGSPLFDDLVGVGEQRRRHFAAERLGCRDIDNKFELGRAVIAALRACTTRDYAFG
jgi:hypothetical protein